MTAIDLVIAPNPIFKKQAIPVDFSVEEKSLPDLIKNLFDTLYEERGLGLAAPMVGILKRIIVVDLLDDGKPNPKAYINPKIIWSSQEMQDHVEASLCYPGIEATITRPNAIKVCYLDEKGCQQEEEAKGFRATVLQHEIDYLNGKVFLDYIKPVKRQMLMKKMQKYKKLVESGAFHGAGCGHNHAPGETCG